MQEEACKEGNKLCSGTKHQQSSGGVGHRGYRQTETCCRSIKASDVVVKDSTMLFEDNQGLLPAGSHDIKRRGQVFREFCRITFSYLLQLFSASSLMCTDIINIKLRSKI